MASAKPGTVHLNVSTDDQTGGPVLTFSPSTPLPRFDGRQWCGSVPYAPLSLVVDGREIARGHLRGVDPVLWDADLTTKEYERIVDLVAIPRLGATVTVIEQ